MSRWTSHKFCATIRSVARTVTLYDLMGPEALKRIGISRRKAAKRAGMSDTRWGQIVLGVERKGGYEIPSPGPAGTVAKMALAIGVTPAQLRSAKRPDAADILDRILTDASYSPDQHVLLRDATQQQLVAELARRAG